MYRTTIITPSIDPNQGGFALRVRNLAKMISSFSKLTVVMTDCENHEEIENTKFLFKKCRDTMYSKFRRLITCYKTDHPRLSFKEADLVQIENLDLLALSKYFPEKPIILDQHNVYWNLQKYEIINSPFFRKKAVKKLSFFKELMSRWLYSRAKEYEVRALEKVDHILVTSSRDRDEILKEVPDIENKISVIPNCLDTTEYSPQPYEAERSKYRMVLFMGTFNYIPNIDALKIICRNIAPTFDESIRFIIIGREPPPISGVPKNVDMLGYVRDIRPWLAHADVCIAPLRLGSGTRIKILEYMAMGKPVVSTAKGVEGLEVENRKNVIIEDDVDEFATHIKELLSNSQLSLELGRNARKLVETRYDWRIYVDHVKEVYDKVLKRK
jgi:glycosyltransferase involved in cell wall biosynthesis